MSHKCNPAHILMSHGGTQHFGHNHEVFPGSGARKYASGGHTVPVEGEAKANAEGGFMPTPAPRSAPVNHPFAEGGYADGGDAMRHGGRRCHHRAEGGSYAEGGYADGGYADGGAMAEGGSYADGGETYASGGDAMRQGGRRRHNRADGGSYAEGGYASGGDAMRRGGRRHRADGGSYADGGYADGGYADGGYTMRRGGRRHRADGWTTNPNTDHPGYGLLGGLLGNIPIVGDLANALLASGGHATGGALRRGGRRHRADGGSFAEGGYADGGATNPNTGHPGYGVLGDVLGGIPLVGGLLGGLANTIGLAEGGNASLRRGGRRHRADGGSYADGGYADGGDTTADTHLRHGGRRRRADGGELSRAMGGVGKLRKHYPYT